MNEGYVIAVALILMAICFALLINYISKKVDEYENEIMHDYMKEKQQDYIGEIEPDEVEGNPV